MNVDKVIFEAPTVRSLLDLSRMFGMNACTMRYKLMKAHKLELVKNIIYWANDEKPYRMPKNRKSKKVAHEEQRHS